MFQSIKRAVLSAMIKDEDQVQISQADYNGRTGEVEMVWPYGFSANPPVDSLLLMFNVMCQEENRAAIASYPQLRFKNLKPSEVQIGNFVKLNSVKFCANGDIEMTSTNDTTIRVTKNFTLEVLGNVAIAIGGGVTMSIAGDVNINGAGANTNINLYGNYKLGGTGGAAIARVGDSVVCPAGTGHITTGSAKHSAT